MSDLNADRDALEERKKFLGINDQVVEDARALKGVISEILPAILGNFYEHLSRWPKMSAMFSSSDRIAHARDAQFKHWLIIAEGDLGLNYVESVRRIGRTHAKIGLEPRWYIGGYSHISSALQGAIVRQLSTGLLGASKQSVALAERRISSLNKLVMLDMDYAISVYIDALAQQASAERKTREDNARSFADAQQRVVEQLANGLEHMSDGDLTFEFHEPLQGEYRKIGEDFNRAVGKLREAMSVVASNATAIRVGSSEISSAADDLSQRTEHQAASLEQTAAALDEVTATVSKTADGAKQAAQAVESARGDAEQTRQVVQDAVSAMTAIEESSQKISQIIGVIDEIAFQTNLLALNAGVEAARAGDAGRGFAVVASEVRALAQRSADAAREIKALISSSSSQVSSGVSLVGQSGDALRRIAQRVTEIDTLVREIAASAQEQSTALGQVNAAVNQMDQVTQQNAAMVEETTAASHALSREADALETSLSSFNIGVNHAAKRAARPQATTPHRQATAAPSSGQTRNGNTRLQHAAQPAADDWEEF